MTVLVLLISVLMLPPLAAQTWQEPARGTATGAALMVLCGRMRPHGEWGATDVWYACGRFVSNITA